jgi:hypothetical protein
VKNGLDKAITDMQRTAEEMRSTASENYVDVTETRHIELLRCACFGMVEIAEMLDIASLNHQDVVDGSSAQSEVLAQLDDRLTINSDEVKDWDWFEENSVDSEEICDRRMN